MSSKSWQDDLLSVRERDMYLLRHSKLTDCTFRVGPEEDRKEFPCHRLMLAKTSVVFEVMLYKELYNEDEVIEIPDVSPQGFQAMLNYIYGGEIEFSDYQTTCELLYLAKKYQLPIPLTEACRAFLWANLYPPENVWVAIEFANSNDEQTLLKTAWMVVQKFTTAALASSTFPEISHPTLLQLVSSDNLSCSEPELYEASVSWARREVVRRGLSGDPQAIREVLGEALKHIRFLSMSAKEVSEGPVKDEVLKVDEACPIFDKMNDPEKDAKLPEIVCQIKEARGYEDPKSFYVHGCPPEYWKVVEDWKEYTHEGDTNLIDILTRETKDFSYDHDGHVGIRIPSQIKPPGCLSDSYEENVTVLVHNLQVRKKNRLVSENHFKRTVKYNSYIDIFFATPFYLKSEEDKLIHKVTVICHSSGEYPMNYNVNHVSNNSRDRGETGAISDGEYQYWEDEDSKFVMRFWGEEYQRPTCDNSDFDPYASDTSTEYKYY